MYIANLVINGTTLQLSAANGYYISTIGGMTGTSAKLQVVQNAIGIGETYTNGTVSGITITVMGHILDNNVTAKQNLLNAVVPLGEGTFTIYNKDTTGGQSRMAPYRTINVVVASTPTITQLEHASFAFSLYAPYPVWKAQTASAIALLGSLETSVTVDGQVDAEYLLDISPGETAIKDFTLALDGFGTGSKMLYLDMRKYDADGVSDKITVRMDKGKVSVLVGNTAPFTNATQCLWSQSTFLSLPAGAHTLQMLTDSSGTIARFAYYPSYVGVVLNCS